jgi:hypothetical protein
MPTGGIISVEVLGVVTGDDVGTASPGCHDALEKMVEPEATTLAGTLKLFVCGFAGFSQDLRF